MFDNLFAAILAAFVVSSPAQSIDCNAVWKGNTLYKSGNCAVIGHGSSKGLPSYNKSPKKSPVVEGPGGGENPPSNDDGNNGHGNDPDHDDDSNPGKGRGNHGTKGHKK